MAYFMFTVIGLQFAFDVYVFSNGPSWSAFTQLIPLLLIFVSYLAIWLFRKRIKNWIPHLYIVNLIFQFAVFVLGTPISQAIKSPEDQ